MLRIRLRRTGRKNQPFFQIVVIEKSAPPKGGRAKEVVGFLNPVTKEKEVKEERVKHWLSVGAKPSDTVHNLLVEEGMLKGPKKEAHARPEKQTGPEEGEDVSAEGNGEEEGKESQATEEEDNDKESGEEKEEPKEDEAEDSEPKGEKEEDEKEKEEEEVEGEADSKEEAEENEGSGAEEENKKEGEEAETAEGGEEEKEAGE